MVVKVGDPIPLNLQLHDGRDDTQPVATIFTDKGLKVGEVALTHFGEGLYLDKSFPMPDVPHIVAQYRVLKDQKPIDDYEIVTDFFYAVQPEKPEPKFAVGVIVDEIKQANTGRVINESSVTG